MAPTHQILLPPDFSLRDIIERSGRDQNDHPTLKAAKVQLRNSKTGQECYGESIF